MKITYKEFRSYLEKEDYAPWEIRHLFRAVKAMDRESRIWVIRWFHQGVLPQKEVEGVTVDYLIEKRGYKPLNAFIVLDWLKKDPQAAKYFILKIPSTISPSESIGEEIVKFVDGADLLCLDKAVKQNEEITEG